MSKGNRWREQAEAKMRDFHLGRGKDDPGPIGTLALELLDRSEDIEHLVLVLERINGKSFDRFDTDKGNGIDLPEILRIAAVWGKYAMRPASRRSHRYELLRIREAYNTSPDPEMRDRLFQETWTRAMDLAKSKGSGSPGDPYKVEMQYELYVHLRRKFGDRPSDNKIAEAIDTILSLIGISTGDPESIERAIKRRMREPLKEYAERAIKLRRDKLIRRTGSPLGINK